MSRDRNLFVLTGRLGSAPEVRTTQSGSKVAEIRVANNDDYFDKNKQEWVERVHWLSISCYGPLAESAEKLSKGDKVDVMGRIVNANYTDKNGKTVYKDRLVANSIIVLERRNKAQTQQRNQAPRDDEPPF